MKKETINPTALASPKTLANTSLAAAVPDWPDVGSVPMAKVPISRKMPGELAEHIKVIAKWGKKNNEESRREAIYFWALKIPVIIATSSYGAMLHFGFEPGLAILGAIASAFTLIDGFYRPGELRNFHHKAYFELSNLANDLVAKWHAGVLSGERDTNKLAAALIEESRMRQAAISAYLTEAEATLGKDQPVAKK